MEGTEENAAEVKGPLLWDCDWEELLLENSTSGV